MDPLSITASAIAIVGATTPTIKLLKRLTANKNAPLLVIAVEKELSDLRASALTIQDLIKGQTQEVGNHDVIIVSDMAANGLKSAVHAIDELHDLLKPVVNLVLDPGCSARKKWYILIRKEKRLSQVKGELRNIRNSLDSVLATLGLYVTTVLTCWAYFPRRSIITTGQHGSRARNGANRIGLCRRSSMHLKAVVSSVRNEILAVRENQKSSEEAYHQSMRSFAGQMGSLSKAILDQGHLAEQGCDKPVNLDGLDTGRALLPVVECNTNSETVTDITNWQARPSNNTCLCHRRRSKRSARTLDQFIGSLYVMYSGGSFPDPRCNPVNCVQRSKFSDFLLSLTYFFPAWILSWAFTLIVKRSKPGFDFNFRVYHCVTYSSPIFQYAYQGDVSKLKSLLQNRLGSPFDVTSEPQRSLLTVQFVALVSDV